MELLHKGKVKEVYAANEDELVFQFTDQISVFDKIIPTLVPKKGETLCRTSAFWFKRAEEMGIRTHFIGLDAPDRMRVKRVDILPYEKTTPESTRFLIPLEVVCRHYVAGNLHDRLKRGDVKPEDLGFPANEEPAYGAKLPEPLLEFTTKLEKVDRLLTEEEALEISKLSPEELQEVKDTVLRLDAEMQRICGRKGLIHVDGKKEFAYDENRNLILVDTFGTADEDRWWNVDDYESGNLRELSKEFVRQHYRDTGYHDKLMEARRAGETEPDIPALPDAVTAQVTDLYTGLYERITGEEF